MDEIKQLKEALRSAPPEEWVSAALSALDEPGMSYCGKSSATVPAHYVLDIYKIKLTLCREDVRSHIESLLNALRELPSSTPISIKPFLGGSRFIGSFWTSGRLIACITNPGKPPENLLEGFKTASK